MKKTTLFFTLLTLLSGVNLQAQQTGEAASSSSNTGRINNWQNWVFAGSALMTASLGILVVSMSNGNSSSSTTSHGH